MAGEVSGAAALAVTGLSIARQTQENLGQLVTQAADNARAIADQSAQSNASQALAAEPPAAPSESGRGGSVDISV